MIVQIDTREKSRAIKSIVATFDRLGVKHISSKLYVGDYMSLYNPRLVVDRKRNLLEVCGNVAQDLPRFRRELERARDAGIKMVVLVEHGPDVREMPDVLYWRNPRLSESPMALSGERLYRKMAVLARSYGVDWQFCTKAQTGRRILEILGGEQRAQERVD